ncbi:MAG: low affinity iron permease family protein [Pyrinomonadaceae bacterium]
MGNKKNSFFTRFAKWTSNITGKSYTFIGAAAVIVIWAVTGPIFNYSDTWQLVINTGTTIITFLMVFLIQNTQNRDTEALQLKLDELISSVKEANNRVLDLEELDDKELDEIRRGYLEKAKKAHDEDDAEEAAEKSGDNQRGA